jgi:hypothetical protein
MNVIRFVLLGFYIFRGEKLQDDYIKFYKLGILHVKTWMIFFVQGVPFSSKQLFQEEFLSPINIY